MHGGSMRIYAVLHNQDRVAAWLLIPHCFGILIIGSEIQALCCVLSLV